jgi:hypothetical protein
MGLSDLMQICLDILGEGSEMLWYLQYTENMRDDCHLSSLGTWHAD